MRDGGRKKLGNAVSGSFARLRAARKAFERHPAGGFWGVLQAIPSGEEVRLALHASGVETRPWESALREIEEAAEYAQAAADAYAWDALAVEVDRALAALARLEQGLGLRPDVQRTARFPRLRLAETLNVLFFERDAWVRTFAPWRRLDVALRALARARRTPSFPQRIAAIRIYAAPGRLRPHYRVGPVHADVRREVERLFDEAQEAADYALAAMEQGVAADVDLDRLDAALRALRHILQRESPRALPEPWLFRLPGRIAAIRALRREIRKQERESFAKFEIDA